MQGHGSGMSDCGESGIGHFGHAYRSERVSSCRGIDREGDSNYKIVSYTFRQIASPILTTLLISLVS